MPITRTSSFPTNVILSDALGTPGAPTSYFGFANAVGTQVASTGPRLQSGVGNPNGVLTSPIGSIWIDSSTGTTYTNTDGATTWALFGGGSSAVRDWFPLVQQAPLNAKSDYFPGTTLNPIWTEWDAGANTTVSVSGSTRLQLLQTSHAGVAMAGIVQTVPASARYAITLMLGLSGRVIGVMDGGLILGGDLIGAPATAPLISWEQIYQTTPTYTLSFNRWTDYATFIDAPFLIASLGQSIMLVRAFVDTVAATIQLLTSPTGQTWSRWHTVAFAATPMAAAPTTMGIMVDNQATGADVAAYASMFRVDATTDPFLPCGGFA